MYEDAFLRFGRLSHLMQCLGYHPQYLSHSTLTLDFIMHGNGPLRLDIRNYIAVLVRIGDTSQVLEFTGRLLIGCKSSQMFVLGEVADI